METINQMASTAMKAVWGKERPTKLTMNQSLALRVTYPEESPMMLTGQDDQKRVASNMNGNANGNLNGHDNTHASQHVNGSANGSANDSTNTSTPTLANKSKSQHDLTANDEDKRRDLDVEADRQDTQDQKDKPKTKPEDEEDEDSEPKLEGKGPQPLEVVAKEHGGNAAFKEDSKPSDPSDSASENNERKSDESKGTGEQYIKTTGLAADGGDFDATKPGAGREADRLMEEKGIHHEEGDNKKGGSDGDSHGHGHGHGNSHGKDKDKPSLGERIKNKLHKH
ncbi:hypothetical protein PT974_10258 [Cladobotryum mycophilum]|uniref:Uncharacterized protein n=1 Tax=Cladobotryum mycophilum TaxID=491253 RepID=A0ABR0S9C4_9HYPO